MQGIHMHEHAAQTSSNFADIAFDVVQDAVIDTLYLIPFLLVTYLVMEWLEHKTGEKTQDAIRKAGAAGPIVGAVLGVVPQCGFSAAASTLYAGRVIGLGTLIAVFLSTSDEMLPIFIAEQVPLNVLLGMLGIKLVIGMVFGIITGWLFWRTRSLQPGMIIHIVNNSTAVILEAYRCRAVCRHDRFLCHQVFATKISHGNFCILRNPGHEHDIVRNARMEFCYRIRHGK